jgi:hypothetical protein
VAAIEIYNKSDFLYREEAFAVLAINGSELLLKSKWPPPARAHYGAGSAKTRSIDRQSPGA